MSFQSMSAELRGTVPKLPYEFAKTLVNRAWRTVRERNLWSFLLFEGQWIAPGIVSTGTASVTQGVATATLDSAATTALVAAAASQTYSLITQRQFRIGLGGTGIYNIWAWDGGSILTLDRPYGEATVSGAGYNIFQAFYVPQANAATLSTANPPVLTVLPRPLRDFKSWISVRNMQNFTDLYTSRINRTDLDRIDPQRSQYFFPTDVVPYETDQNPASATYGYFMYELWGNPTANWSYQLLGIRHGLDLISPSDTLPFAVGDDCVVALAKYYAYQWAEANRDQGNGHAYYSGPDYKFLMGAVLKEYDTLLRTYRMADREQVDNFFVARRTTFPNARSYYNSIAQTANPG